LILSVPAALAFFPRLHAGGAFFFYSLSVLFLMVFVSSLRSVPVFSLGKWFASDPAS
jgi:hypothetical protein